MGPLQGLRVLDLTSVLMGPYATQILGDFGADIIKVEAPEGDVTRQIGPTRNAGMGAVFLNTNRSKGSVALDLKTPEGRDVAIRLARDCDVVVSNIRPRAMARLGLSYEALSAENPRLIHAALVGFDQRGPYADRPAYDDLIQGGSGIAHSFVRAGQRPSYVPAAIADRIVGLAAVNAILAAVVERDRSGLGQQVEVPMFETMLAMILGDHLGGLTYDPPMDQGGYARHLSPDRRPYQTSDGYICALIYNDGHWNRFFAAIGRPEMPAADPRYATFASRMQNIDAVYAELGEILLTRSTADWLALFDAADVPALPMHSYASALEDPHLVATGFFENVEHPSEGAIRSMAVPTRFSRSPAQPEKPAPRLGADTARVLGEAGFSADEIAALAQSGAFGRPQK
ncbi:CoA transferase [Pseudooceanicola sp.]|uniref:CaiB/BaiF CoA transferase family protein n=1 Tax=Pseudooceanicola sp. TaxID=1914328 RepID=UPI00262AD0A9|nr:CoA transferase [Pseudooceanicola sp.]MDF1855302.1 CoA transferase [Pseudooceanicola sp.]